MNVDQTPLPLISRTSTYGAQSREARDLMRAAKRSGLHRVHPGAYVSEVEWQALKEHEQHVLKVLAAMPRLSRRLVVSHWSAAALHGLPLLGKPPSRVHVTDPARGTAHGSTHVVRHARPLRPDEVVSIYGVTVTTLERTCVDIALTAPFAEAVAALDAALRRGSTSASLAATLEAHPAVRGRRGAERAITFASPSAESAGESLARVVLDRLGVPEPVLQKKFERNGTLIGRVDFWFPEQGVALEFDGKNKYENELYRNGRTPAQVAWDERRREVALLRLDEIRSVERTIWQELFHPEVLSMNLRAAGVPCLA